MRISEDRSGLLITCTGNTGRSPVLTGELVPVDKGDSRPRHLQGKGVNTGLVRQTWGLSLFGPM